MHGGLFAVGGGFLHLKAVKCPCVDGFLSAFQHDQGAYFYANVQFFLSAPGGGSHVR